MASAPFLDIYILNFLNSKDYSCSFNELFNNLWQRADEQDLEYELTRLRGYGYVYFMWGGGSPCNIEITKKGKEYLNR